VKIIELRKGLDRGIAKVKNLAQFVGYRFKVELALWTELKEYEQLKEKLNQLYAELGKKFYEEGSMQTKESFKDLIDKITLIQEQIKKKEQELQLLTKPETE